MTSRALQRSPARRSVAASGCLLILATLLLTLTHLYTRALLDSLTETKPSLPLRSTHSLGRHMNSNSTRQNNGLTDVVEWDNYSLFIKGQRVFIWSVPRL
jgi:hypothetical protein